MSATGIARCLPRRAKPSSERVSTAERSVTSSIIRSDASRSGSCSGRSELGGEELDAEDQVVEVMCDPTGERPDGFQALGASEALGSASALRALRLRLRA